MFVLTNVLRDFWAEAAPPADADGSTWDRIVVVVLVVFGIIDGLVSNEVGWPVIHVGLMTALPVVLLWRRSHTLRVAVIVSVCVGLLHGAMLVAGVSSTIVNAGVIGVTVYSLARWASGRHALVGLGLAAVALALAGSTGVIRTIEGAIGLPVFISLFGLVGLSLRLWSSRSTARLSEAKTLERTRIARELHDSVAHHVSAIAVQAQGAQEVLSRHPELAAEALGVIEQQASQTLAEMRLILGVLRTEDGVDRAPQPGIADIARLADGVGSGPKVAVTMSGELDRVGPSVAAGLFRLTQEAITNARRHARHASRIAVQVEGLDDHVRLTVTDNGRASSPASPGYGIVGMRERASLLGGECSAGPTPDGGWLVEALLPSGGHAA